MSESVVWLKDHQPCGLKFDRLEMTFDIISLSEVIVEASMHFEASVKEIVLDGQKLELIECSIKLNLKLLIVGDGPLLYKLKTLASGRPSNINFMGSIENSKMSEVLNSAKIFVLNSEFEATSYALIEAKMCGLPVLAKETDGSLTLVQKDIDGLVYSSGKGISLEGAISKLINNKELIDLFGSESRKDALLRFNEQINFAKILALMEI
jgi:glycosyltransferase involved in cell wall biosynthesis